MIAVYITACGVTAESAILLLCYTASIISHNYYTESLMFAVYITACGFTAEDIVLPAKYNTVALARVGGAIESQMKVC